MFGVIGGSGIYSLGKTRKKTVKTEHGNVLTNIGKIGNIEYLFIPRHGKTHHVPPHKVNYRANLLAMKNMGVKKLIGIYATGIIGKYSPGDIILLEDFIGFYSQITYFDSFAEKMEHTDMSEPYNRKLSKQIYLASKSAGIDMKKGGIIATTSGPRFETKAEIKALKILGANLVNMTGAYEATLAAELKIPFCGIAVGTNYGAGIKDKKILTHTEVLESMKSSDKKIKKILAEFGKNTFSA